ncbi:Integrase recombinase xerD-like, partial [Paramuricea clavata]
LVDQGEDEGHTDGGRSRSNSREPRSRRDSRSHDRSRHRHSHTSSRRSEISSRRRVSRNEERGSSRRHSSRSKDSVERARSKSEEPPVWAKEILENQQKTAQDLLRLKTEISTAKLKVSNSTAVPKVAEPEFRYQGNKKQYELNKNVLAHVDRALTSHDMGEISVELSQGKRILEERNKHILLAEKYGWDTVHCYTAEPLASDSEDEKRIKRAVKEGKQLKNEKAAEAVRFKPNKQIRAPERRSFGGDMRASYSQSSRDNRMSAMTCFRCFKPGHLARECRTANARFVIGSTPQANQNDNWKKLVVMNPK